MPLQWRHKLCRIDIRYLQLTSDSRAVQVCSQQKRWIVVEGANLHSSFLRPLNAQSVSICWLRFSSCMCIMVAVRVFVSRLNNWRWFVLSELLCSNYKCFSHKILWPCKVSIYVLGNFSMCLHRLENSKFERFSANRWTTHGLKINSRI